VCTDQRNQLGFTFSDHDQTDPTHQISCVQVEFVEDVAKAGYWAWRAWQWLKSIPPPIPP
jgi:hypothetical protein